VTAYRKTWHPLAAGDLADVADLAGRVLAADGGLPLVAEPGFLAGRFAGEGVRARGMRDEDGRLVAAGAVRPAQTGLVATGMVEPAWRGRGLGADLLDWALAAAPGAVVVETESLTEAAERLFADRGLRQVFAEDVMRFDLAHHRLPAVELPAGVRLEGWSDAAAPRFFAVYAAAFADRPGFPGWSAERWVDWLAGDEEFRPDLSLLAVDPRAGDVAFIGCADGWIAQVGVRPDQRGRGLGAALVVEALRRMRAEGAGAALLDVGVDNPAGALYRRLGFAPIGRRARFAPAS
jgi:mycothiol synthase